MRQSHAAPPAVCSDCLDRFMSSIAAGIDTVLFLRCDHKGPGTLVRVQVAGGLVTSWRTAAPITREEAQKQIADHAIALKEAGLLAPNPRPN